MHTILQLAIQLRPLLINSSSSSESVSPHNFLTCFSFSRSEAEAETGFGLKEIGLKEMGGRRGRGAAEIAVGTTMEKRERARCVCCGSFDTATIDLLPAAIEAHDEDDDDEEVGFSFF